MTSQRSNSYPLMRRFATTGGVVLITGYVFALAWAMGHKPYDFWGALWLAPILIALPVPVFMAAARRDADRRMVKLMKAALWVKVIGTALRYYVAYGVYGRSDASGYHEVGARVANGLRHLELHQTRGSGGTGTWFIGQVTGWVYTVTGPSRVIGFIVFSWMSFAGLYLFYRAFRLAFPDGDHHRYALLLFFLPSLAYWPSSLGKDAWMMLGLGLTAYGCARLLTFRRWALPLTGVGMWATAMVRPHLTLIAASSLLLGYGLRRSRSGLGVAAKAAGLAAILVVGLVVLTQTKGFFGADSVSSESAELVLDEAQRRTGQGGSTFANQRVRSPADFPIAALTVLFRPFPHEVDNAQTAISALEGVALLGICAWSVRRIRSLPRLLRRTPYVAFSVLFIILFIIAYSSIGNFGILARQRVQAFPLLLVLLCLPGDMRSAPALQRVIGNGTHPGSHPRWLTAGASGRRFSD